jgi:uncharacterized protein (DUF4415 family)
MQVTIRISAFALERFLAGGKVELKQDEIDTISVNLSADNLEVFSEKEPGITGYVTKVKKK